MNRSFVALIVTCAFLAVESTRLGQHRGTKPGATNALAHSEAVRDPDWDGKSVQKEGKFRTDYPDDKSPKDPEAAAVEKVEAAEREVLEEKEDLAKAEAHTEKQREDVTKQEAKHEDAEKELAHAEEKLDSAEADISEAKDTASEAKTDIKQAKTDIKDADIKGENAEHEAAVESQEKSAKELEQAKEDLANAKKDLKNFGNKAAPALVVACALLAALQLGTSQ